jgi:hypothetical protein
MTAHPVVRHLHPTTPVPVSATQDASQMFDLFFLLLTSHFKRVTIAPVQLFDLSFHR